MKKIKALALILSVLLLLTTTFALGSFAIPNLDDDEPWLPYWSQRIGDTFDARATSSQTSASSFPTNVLNDFAEGDSTIWHNAWGGAAGDISEDTPVILEIDMGTELTLTGLLLVTRRNHNGRITAGHIATHPSTENGWPGGDDFLEVGEEWERIAPIPRAATPIRATEEDRDPETVAPNAFPYIVQVEFDEPVTTRFIRLEITNTWSTSMDGAHASLGAFIPLFEPIECECDDDCDTCEDDYDCWCNLLEAAQEEPPPVDPDPADPDPADPAPENGGSHEDEDSTNDGATNDGNLSNDDNEDEGIVLLSFIIVGAVVGVVIIAGILFVVFKKKGS